ncbi:MAG: hypothetical protein GY717_16825 [Rhodobacteraceae bacterium]|nr:hypothetical protein [Paracoccaceae bacterium]
MTLKASHPGQDGLHRSARHLFQRAGHDVHTEEKQRQAADQPGRQLQIAQLWGHDCAVLWQLHSADYDNEHRGADTERPVAVKLHYGIDAPASQHPHAPVLPAATRRARLIVPVRAAAAMT